jgi:UDP-N-acetylglucosamine acyltransferase
MSIHPTAIVSTDDVEIDSAAEIGAYSIIEPHVRIGPGVKVYPHAYIAQGTTLAARVQVHPFAVVGHLPQDFKFSGEPTFTFVDEDTVIREHCAVHRGTHPGTRTFIGRRCLLMCIGHVGHNCVIGDDAVIAGTLGGHVEVGPRAFVSSSVVHQFVRVGELAMIGGGLRLVSDLPPFMLFGPQGIQGANVVGMRRAAFSPAERHELRRCHRVLFRSGMTLPRAIERLTADVQHPPGLRLLDFLRQPSRRGLGRFRPAGVLQNPEDGAP